MGQSYHYIMALFTCLLAAVPNRSVSSLHQVYVFIFILSFLSRENECEITPTERCCSRVWYISGALCLYQLTQSTDKLLSSSMHRNERRESIWVVLPLLDQLDKELLMMSTRHNHHFLYRFYGYRYSLLYNTIITTKLPLTSLKSLKCLRTYVFS